MKRKGQELDGLRLIALGRVDRCSGCARYLELLRAWQEVGPPRALPPAPASCSYRICAPLARKHGAGMALAS